MPEDSGHISIDTGALFGRDQTPRIVAVERFGERNVRVYVRNEAGVHEQVDQLEPWLVASPVADGYLTHPVAAEELGGTAEFNLRYRFDSWSQWNDAYRALRDSDVPVIAFPSPVEQYLIDSGRGLFRAMPFDQLVRAQLDIETLGLDPAIDDARIILITASINGRNPIVLRGDELSEPEMIDAITNWMQSVDPDVIEGHNLFNFDLAFLEARGRRYRRALLWGRDGSAVRFGNEQRFKAGARTIPFRAAWVYGRHFVDTYQQIQRYDITGQLDSYALKPAIAALGLARSDRTFVAGEAITEAWNTRREELIRYATDDVLDVNTLSELALPTEFYQARLLPRGLQSVATGGPGEKVNDMFVRAYISLGQSVPRPALPRDYPGAFAEVRRVGRFSPVVKCDAESLYPSIMLADGIAPASDQLGIFLPALRILTDRRLQAKRAEQQSAGKERAQWRGIQSSFKVLINSFYGYLGYSRGYFNDYDAATQVTLRGQEIVQQLVAELESRGALTIEIDTDGVFFQPPADVSTEEDELALIDAVSVNLGDGIRIAHDGRYLGMLSLKLKNYALLNYDGRVSLKGSSLRSRREELVLRRFVADAVARLLDPDLHGDVREYYLDVAEQIARGELEPRDIARVETITDQTFSSDSNRRLAEAVAGERVGERIVVYQRAGGALARIENYANDEDRTYLLRRIRDMAERFRPLFPTDAEFDYTFPTVTQRSNIASLRDAQPVTQLDLFGAFGQDATTPGLK
jgi:DNA polymerase, archaea type